MNIFEVMYDVFKPFLDGEKRPLNVIEVSNLWFFLAITENTLRNEEISYNICTEKELKEKLKEAKESIHLPIKIEIEEFLRKEGVQLPDAPPSKPLGDFRSIPAGAKLSDNEIANLMSFNLLLGVTYAARGLTESIRTDVGLIFSKIIVRKTTFGLVLKELMDKRGWLQIPPYYKV